MSPQVTLTPNRKTEQMPPKRPVPKSKKKTAAAKPAAKKKTAPPKGKRPPSKPASKKPPGKPAGKKTTKKKTSSKNNTTPVTRQEFEAFTAAVSESLVAQAARLDVVQIVATGLDPNWASVSEEGRIVLNIEEAPRHNLRKWAHQFSGFGDYVDLEDDEIRTALIEHRDSDDFEGFITLRTDLPDEEEEGEEEEEEDDDEGDDESEDDDDDDDASAAEIRAALGDMNWASLKDIADQLELDYSDIAKPPQAKKLRARLDEALAEVEDGEGEEGEADDDAEWEEGCAITVTVDDETYPGIYKGVDEDGDILFVWEEGGEGQCITADSVELA